MKVAEIHRHANVHFELSEGQDAIQLRPRRSDRHESNWTQQCLKQCQHYLRVNLYAQPALFCKYPTLIIKSNQL